jgi:Rrf2 family protein
MQISTKGRYGLRFILDLAVHGRNGKSVPLRDVAERQDISEKYLWQVVLPLKRAGLVKASRGAHGGYTLAKKPEEMSLRDILVVLEGDFSFVDCTHSVKACARSRGCAARSIWQELEEKLSQAMEAIKVQDVLVRCGKVKDEDSAGLNYVI